jgi:hypothetical protein
MTVSNSKTTTAFNAFRLAFAPAKELRADRVQNADQIKQMGEADGLKLWQDGPVEDGVADPGVPTPDLTSESDAEKMLWVVRASDVPYAQEASEFGRKLESRVIKHSNLTGGGPAFCGGELLVLDHQTIVVNGRSGRYGPRSDDELTAVVAAFRKSGYFVWHMGYDVDADQPLPFVGSQPIWFR